MAKGNLKVSVATPDGALPIKDALVRILDKDTEKVIEAARTDKSGQVTGIELDAPLEEISLNEKTDLKGYSEYDMTITAEGYDTVIIKNVQIMPNETAIQNVLVWEKENPLSKEIIEINDIVVAGDYPKKFPEDPIKDEGPGSGFVVLDRPVIPQYIVVHNGRPDQSATNYTVAFTDYIKNVASSEIYSTWPYETIKANVYCILSFTLNRVYTEWYRSKGYDFTITALPAYDRKRRKQEKHYKDVENAVYMRVQRLFY